MEDKVVSKCPITGSRLLAILALSFIPLAASGENAVRDSESSPYVADAVVAGADHPKSAANAPGGAAAALKYYEERAKRQALTRPSINIKADPGCGVERETASSRIEHGRNLAELYFQGYVEGKDHQYLYNWFHHDCFADEWTLIPANIDPWARPIVRHRMSMAQQKKATAAAIIKAAWEYMPDFKALPGSFVVQAWDGGATWHFLHVGHFPNGKLFYAWEKDTILLNKKGEIVHFEFYLDTKNLEEMEKGQFGIGFHGMTHSQYRKFITDALKSEFSGLPMSEK